MVPSPESGKAGQVRYWQYGLAGNSPNLAKSDPSRREWESGDRSARAGKREERESGERESGERESGERESGGKARQVRYWQYGLAGNSPNLAKSDPSRLRPQ